MYCPIVPCRSFYYFELWSGRLYCVLHFSYLFRNLLFALSGGAIIARRILRAYLQTSGERGHRTSEDNYPSPLPSNYEQFRQEAFQVKAREEQKKMEVVTSYTQRTLAAYMSEEELTKLCEQIIHYLSSEWSVENSQNIKVSSQLKSIDLMHFGWNISRPFGKKREDIALFLKHTFAHTLKDVEVSSIQRKLTNTEGKYLIHLCKDLVIDEHSTPLESYPKVT